MLRFTSYQTVGVYLLGLDFLVCRDLLDILLSFLQPMTNRPAGTQCVQILRKEGWKLSESKVSCLEVVVLKFRLLNIGDCGREGFLYHGTHLVSCSRIK